ncbi:hypothetical protein EXS65_01080 [Candidatus Peribacteria bacterium]|nr:hypothetical protein [Candidatus Peribacteria bacterium]
MFQRHRIQNQSPMLITTNTRQREPIFADYACAREAIESLYRVQMFTPFFLFGFVIMPDHCHFVLNVPEGGSISKIMCAYKRSVCFEIGKPIWQSRFHVKILDDVAAALRYVHFNPVKKNLCEQIDEYPWSSASGRWDISEIPVL